MAKVILNSETFTTTKHGLNFINWCKGFFTDESAAKVLNAILNAHKDKCRQTQKKLNLDEFLARRTVNELCQKELLYRRRDGQRANRIS